MDNNEVKLINIRQVLRQKAPSASRKIPDFLVNYLIRLVHQEELNDIILRYQDKEGVEFMESLIRYFDLTLQVHGDIPESGRYLFVSNHPLGGMDGICLSALIGRKYDGKIRNLVNDLLLYLRNLQSIFVPINKHGAQSKENALRIEEAYASDNQIITFPAGLCSRKIKGKIVRIVIIFLRLIFFNLIFFNLFLMFIVFILYKTDRVFIIHNLTDSYFKKFTIFLFYEGYTHTALRY